MLLCSTVPTPFTGQRLAGKLVYILEVVARRALPIDRIFLVCLAGLPRRKACIAERALKGQAAADSTTGLRLGQYWIEQEPSQG
ncbi:hypothetical protein E2C01_035453 [Portunus trituberculatus]|uniref:Uncharacterized protein n=1 Tax=Portunus trituberculatus TaxID=210409 RepID=A0A5B7F974_PORTR|nr:hypothetical protein [Portunus trituberculatus]